MSTSLQIIASNQTTEKLKPVSPFLKSNSTNLVLQFLNHQELIFFEMAASGHRDITHQTWKFLRVRDFQTATFSDCESEDYSEKFNYVLGKIAFKISGIKANYVSAIQLQKKYSFYMKDNGRFKHLGGCLEKIIRFTSEAIYPDSPELLEKLRSLEDTALKACVEGNRSGDIFLQGVLLSYYKTTNQQKLYQIFKHAIQNGATECSLLLFNDSQTHLDLAIQAATKKDFRSLEQYLKKQNLNLTELLQIEDQYGFFPPLAWKIFQITALHLTDNEIAAQFEGHLDKTYEGYGNRAPKELLFTLGVIKNSLNKLNEAEKIYEKIISSFKCDFSEAVFAHLLQVKINLSKFHEANEIVDQLLKCPTPRYYHALYTKFFLSKFEEAAAFIPIIDLKIKTVKNQVNTLKIEAITYLIMLELVLNKNIDAENRIKDFVTNSKDLENDCNEITRKAKRIIEVHPKLNKDIYSTILSLLDKHKNLLKKEAVGNVESLHASELPDVAPSPTTNGPNNVVINIVPANVTPVVNLNSSVPISNQNTNILLRPLNFFVNLFRKVFFKI